jgi:predicted Zn-dependent protease with MMP-like domain/cytochrome c-type biogenesis protein CcmH/NrfG
MSSEEKMMRLVDEAEEAIAEGDAERALELAEEALALAPEDPWALLVKASALYAMDDLDADDDADDALAEAVDGPEADVGVLLYAANVLLGRPAADPGAGRHALELLARAAKEVPDDEDATAWRVDIARTRGRTYSQLDELEPSLRAFDDAYALAGDAADAELLAEVGIARFEMCRFDDAQAALSRAEAMDDQDPDVQLYLGLIAERAGDMAAAAQRFAKARRLDPDHFPVPVALSEDEFEEVVAEALAKVPEEVQRALANVPLIVQPMPELDDLVGPPALSPLSLGMFKGPVEPGAAAARVENTLPNEIHLYQTNLERFCATREELVQEVEQTLLHEIGHFVGWDEDDLHARGLH